MHINFELRKCWTLKSVFGNYNALCEGFVKLKKYLCFTSPCASYLKAQCPSIFIGFLGGTSKKHSKHQKHQEKYQVEKSGLVTAPILKKKDEKHIFFLVLDLGNKLSGSVSLQCLNRLFL